MMKKKPRARPACQRQGAAFFHGKSGPPPAPGKGNVEILRQYLISGNTKKSKERGGRRGGSRERLEVEVERTRRREERKAEE